MKTHSHIQRHSRTESSEPLITGQQAASGPQHESPQAYDISHVDLFSHAPQRVPAQTKLTVGAANDQYEQEADRVADQVLSMPDSATQQPIQRQGGEEDELQMKPLSSIIQREFDSDSDDDELQMKPLSSTVQREFDSDSDDDELQMKPLSSTIQRESDSDSDDDELQMKPLSSTVQREFDSDSDDDELQMKSATAQASNASPALETQLSNSQGSGSPLPGEIRSFMEPRFGADFSGVRVHTGNESIQMNRDLGAQAFTHQQDIYFGSGKSPGNDALTAHELTHVIQQTGAIAPKSDSE